MISRCCAREFLTRGYESDGFKLRCFALFGDSLDEGISEAVFRHAWPVDIALLGENEPISTCPKSYCGISTICLMNARNCSDTRSSSS